MNSNVKEILKKLGYVIIILVPFIIFILLIIFSDINDSNYYGHTIPKCKMQIIGSDKDYYYINITEMIHSRPVLWWNWYLMNPNGKIVGNNFGELYEIYALNEGNVTFHDQYIDGILAEDDIFIVSKILRLYLPNH